MLLSKACKAHAFRTFKIQGPGSRISHSKYFLPRSRVNLIQSRYLKLSTDQANALKGWGFIVNVLAGAYIGGLLVCLGLFYFIYHDAYERQHIPFEISFQDQINAVKAINKDDVLNSPRHAVKHYRKLLIDLAKSEDPNIVIEEEEDLDDKYLVPLLSPSVLIHKKSNNFANFYIDIVLRYSRALLAKGKRDQSIQILKKIIDNDELFYKLGDAEKLSQCCRLLSRVFMDANDKIKYLKRSIDMISRTYSSINIDSNYMLHDQSRISDELMHCLNDLAATYAKMGTSSKSNAFYLNESLNIYLANLKMLSIIADNIDRRQNVQARYPLFNCDPDNVHVSMDEIKVHIGEVMWAKGFKENAVAWCEQVVQDMYYRKDSSARIATLMRADLQLLILMYDKMKFPASRNKCQKLLNEIPENEYEEKSWYDGLIKRFSKIMYHRGPLGIIEKPLLERFGPSRPIPELEEIEDEDSE